VVVEVLFASYGNPMGGRRAAIGLGGCKEDATTSDFRRGGCHAPQSVRAVEKLCVGQPECEVPVGHALFGEPCLGEAKSLAAALRCSPPGRTEFPQYPDEKKSGGGDKAGERRGQNYGGQKARPRAGEKTGGGAEAGDGRAGTAPGSPSAVPPSAQCGRTTEAGTLVLACRGNKGHASRLPARWGPVVTSVTFASYGTPAGRCSSQAGDKLRRSDMATAGGRAGCHAASSWLVVEAACLGKTTCSLPASNVEYGEPCYGTGKHLAAEVQCGLWSDAVAADAEVATAALRRVRAEQFVAGLDQHWSSG
jgi:hypothetical protein